MANTMKWDILSLYHILPEFEELFLRKLEPNSMASLAKVNSSYHQLIRNYGRRKNQMPALLASSNEENAVIPFAKQPENCYVGSAGQRSLQTRDTISYWRYKELGDLSPFKFYQWTVIDAKTLKRTDLGLRAHHHYDSAEVFGNSRYVATAFKTYTGIYTFRGYDIFLFDKENGAGRIGRIEPFISIPCRHSIEVKPRSDSVAFVVERSEERKTLLILKFFDDHRSIQLARFSLDDDFPYEEIELVESSNDSFVVYGCESRCLLVHVVDGGRSLQKKMIYKPATVKFLTKGRFLTFSGEKEDPIILHDLRNDKEVSLPVVSPLRKMIVAEDLASDGSFVTVVRLYKAMGDEENTELCPTNSVRYYLFSPEGHLIRSGDIHCVSDHIKTNEDYWSDWRLHGDLLWAGRDGCDEDSSLVVLDIRRNFEVPMSLWNPKDWSEQTFIFFFEKSLTLVGTQWRNPFKKKFTHLRKMCWAPEEEEDAANEDQSEEQSHK